MTNQDFKPQAAIPSRAAQETPQPAAPVTPTAPVQPAPQLAPAAATHVPGDTVKPPRRKRGPNKKKSEKLSAAEIKKITAKRKAALAKKRGPKAAKNPNRPLEMKNKLSAVLTLTRDLNKTELDVFTTSMDRLEHLTRSGRKRVLAALQQVYP